MEDLFKLESKEEFTQALEEVLKNLFYLKKGSSTCAASEDIENLLFQTNFQEKEIEELLTSKGYEIEKTKCFVSLFEIRKHELMCSAVTSHNSSYGEFVTNFDWVLKLCYGTNELSAIRYPLLQLCLSTCKNRESSQKTFDITRDNLAKLISALESVDAP